MILTFLFLIFTPVAEGSNELAKAIENHRQLDPRFESLKLDYLSSKKAIESSAPFRSINFGGDLSTYFEDGEADFAQEGTLSASFPNQGSAVSMTYRKDPASGIDSSTSLNFSQSLLKNSFGNRSKIQKEKVEFQLILNEVQYKKQLQQYWYDIVRKLVRYHSDQNKLNLYLRITQEISNLYNYVEDRFNSRVALESELLRSKVSLENSKMQIVNIKNDLEKQKREYLITVGLEIPNIDIKLPASVIGEATPLERQEVEILKSIAELEEAEIYDDSRSQLDLVLGANRSKLRGLENENLLAGISFLIPVENKQQDLQLAAASLKAQQSNSDIKAVQTNIESNLNDIVLSQRNVEAQLKAYRANSKLYKSIYKQQRERYTRAAISFDLLVNTQNEMNNLAVSINETEFRQKILQLDRLKAEGRLLEFVHSF